MPPGASYSSFPAVIMLSRSSRMSGAWMSNVARAAECVGRRQTEHLRDVAEIAGTPRLHLHQYKPVQWQHRRPARGRVVGGFRKRLRPPCLPPFDQEDRNAFGRNRCRSANRQWPAPFVASRPEQPLRPGDTGGKYRDVEIGRPTLGHIRARGYRADDRVRHIIKHARYIGHCTRSLRSRSTTLPVPGRCRRREMSIIVRRINRRCSGVRRVVAIEL